MKKVLFLLIGLFILSNPAMTYSQNDVTKFLGIPVDGGKEEFVKQLCSKGFSLIQGGENLLYGSDVLQGSFNGAEVYVVVITNKDKVCRIMVSDISQLDERSIKIRFNKLCQQFENNQKYIALDNYKIPDSENLSYEMQVNKKRYEAAFQQKAIDDPNSPIVIENIKSLIEKTYSPDKCQNLSDDEWREIIIKYLVNASSKKSVWFMISEGSYGKYFITMFYDNEYNRANGEDL